LQEGDDTHPPVGITDVACLPSSLLLRDIHMGLMRLMDGSGPKAGKRGLKPPPAARFCPTDSQRQLQTLLSAPHWSHKAAQVVKQAGAVMTGHEPQVGVGGVHQQQALCYMYTRPRYLHICQSRACAAACTPASYIHYAAVLFTRCMSVLG
jgi:hypothetical protein